MRERQFGWEGHRAAEKALLVGRGGLSEEEEGPGFTEVLS